MAAIPKNIFIECNQCHALYLSLDKSDSHSDFLCDRCMATESTQIEDKFIITCPECKTYWPKHVIQAIVGEGLCHCPKNECEGILRVRLAVPRKKSEDFETEQPQPNTNDPISESNQEIASENVPTQENSINQASNAENIQEQESESPTEAHSTANITELPTDSFNKIQTGAVTEIESDNNPEKIDLSSPTNSKVDSEPVFEEKETPETHDSSESSVADQDTPEIVPEPDFARYSQKLAVAKISELYQLLLTDLKTASTIPVVEYQGLIESMIISLNDRKTLLIEEPVQFIFYTGNLSGDLEQAQKLLRYYQAIIETYPAMKVVFLGNYLNHNPFDFPTIALLYCFYLKFPQNVVLLRGAEETHEKMREGGFWDRLRNFFLSRGATIDEIRSVYQSLLDSLALLPLLHIGSMNQGQVRILSTSSGIPMNRDQDNLAFSLDPTFKQFNCFTPLREKFDITMLDVISGIPDPEINEAFTFNTETGQLQFGVISFATFLRSNKLHYVVRGNEHNADGVKYYFNYMMCSLNSAHELHLPNFQKIEGKIVRLTLGQSPNVISTDILELQKDLEKNFAITDIDL
jgi:hypothetical protein